MPNSQSPEVPFILTWICVSKFFGDFLYGLPYLYTLRVADVGYDDAQWIV